MKKNLAQRIHDYDNPRSIGSRFRAKRIAPLRKMIDKAYQQHGKVSIIDVGGTKTYWKLIGNKILAEKNVTITVVNLAGTLYDGGVKVMINHLLILKQMVVIYLSLKIKLFTSSIQIPS